jgi:ornithine cyclodeaminase/alanine dehydrogenase-like protein (mu-crystallin family)
MDELLYLPRTDVEELLPPLHDQLELVETTYRSMGERDVELPPKPSIHPRPDAFIHAMPAYLRREDVAAVKWIAGYRANKARGLPYLSGLIILSNSETGLPIAVMDAAEITATRTAVASGVCIRRWAPPGWRTAAILGCGVQGLRHALVLQTLNKDVVLQAFDPNPGRAEALLDGAVSARSTPREAVEGAEVVITTGPMPERREPQLSSGWLGPKHLLLPVDFDAYVRREAISDAELFLVDDVGQFEHYRGQGYFQGWPRAHASVGEALDSAPNAERVACVNLGVGALDAVFAKHVYDAAVERGAGIRLPL